MMPLCRTIPLLAAIAFATAACGPKPDAAVQRDLHRYEQQLAKIAPIESEGAEANKRATGNPKGNDATYAVVIQKEIIPAFRAYAAALDCIRPMTNELLGLHAILVKRTETVIAGFVELERSARTGDKAVIEKATALFNEGKLLYRRWSEEMDALHKRYPPET